MRKIFTLIFKGTLSLYLCTLLPEPLTAQTQQTFREIATGPNSGGFIEDLPATYSKDTTKRFPLIIFLAGEGQLGNGTTNLSLMLADGPPQIVAAGQWPDSFVVRGRSFSFIVITPQFKAWPADGDVDSVVQYTLTHYRVDTGRVYMTGFSMGGNNTWSYASTSWRAGMLAGIVPVAAGTMWSGEAGAEAIASNNLPVYSANNRYDLIEPDSLMLNNIAEINGVVPHCSPMALDTVYADSGHDAWTKTYYTGTNLYNGLNCYQWMLQYSRDPGDTLSTPPPPPLPTVELSAYNATLTTNGKAVNVNWTTLEETDNSYFIVQRSTDNSNFTSLATVTSTARSGGGASYQYMDTVPTPGNDYYRLESVDSTGKDSLYPVLLVQIPVPPPPPTPSSSTPPPVALTVYTATAIDNGKVVNVSWTTASEQGNKFFVVQRSTDSIRFSNLDTVAAAGGPETGASYSYTDSTPAPGNNYYRLQRFDTTMNDTLYRVLEVQVNGKLVTLPIQLQLQVSPNPATGLLYLHLVDSTTGTIQVSLTDMSGRLLKIWEFQKQDMVWDASVDVSTFSRGIYVLHIRGTTVQSTRMILKE
jgi:Secretion system C-terminal sorting domain